MITLTRSYTTIDKSAWGEGAWQNEPDKAQWKDEATGLPCLALRGNPYCGNWCGYVGVPETHPLFGKSGDRLETHGGVNFTGMCQDGPEEHSICHVPDPGEPDHIWWFGFDCGHLLDRMPAMEAFERELGYRTVLSEMVECEGMLHPTYKTLGYVQAECAGLARQLAELAGVGAGGSDEP